MSSQGLVIIAFQLVVLGLRALSFVGLNVPVLPEVAGLIYLTFVPGFVILSLFRPRQLDPSVTLLFTVGLSLAFVISIGLAIDLLYPLVGISRPLTGLPVTLTIGAVTLALSVVACRRGWEPFAGLRRAAKAVVSPYVLFLLSLPLLAALGAYLVNVYNDDRLLVVLMALIALMVALIGFDRFIPHRLYPLAVWSIAAVLVYHWSLISPYIYGPDDNYDRIYWMTVLVKGVWLPQLFASSGNSTLSTVMVMPVFSAFSGMDSVWLWKLLYPFIFSLVPLALFLVFKRQTGERIAFLGAFFFMSFYSFVTELSQKATQRPAEFFVALVMLLLVGTEVHGFFKRFLLVAFALCVVVSHYGISYIFMAYLLATLILLSLLGSGLYQRLRHRLTGRSGSVLLSRLGNLLPRGPSSVSPELSPNLVVFFAIFAVTWYLYTSHGNGFGHLTSIISRTMETIYVDFFSTAAHGGLSTMLGSTPLVVNSLERQIFRGILWITLLAIAVGFAAIVFTPRKRSFTTTYGIMVICSLAFLGGSAVVPHLDRTLNATRIYHITLLWLAPLGVIGGASFFEWLSHLIPVPSVRLALRRHALGVLTLILLIPFFLFGVGFVYRVTGDVPASIALRGDSPPTTTDTFLYSREEIQAREWLENDVGGNAMIAADRIGEPFLASQFGQEHILDYSGTAAGVRGDAYVFLRGITVKDGMVMELQTIENLGFYRVTYVPRETSRLYKDVLTNRDTLYDNGGARVYGRLQ